MIVINASRNGTGRSKLMFFTDDDLYEGLKISLETLTDLTKKETDPVQKRKCAKSLANVILALIKMRSDKEDWKFLLEDQTPEDELNEEEDEDNGLNSF